MAERQLDIRPALPMSFGLGQDWGEYPAVADLYRRARSLNPAHPWEEIGRWLESKPPFARWFFKAEELTLGASASRSVVTVFRLPPSSLGVLRFFAVQVGNASDAPNVRYALELNGTPVSGFARIVGPITGSLSTPMAMMDALEGRDQVRVVATNLIASAVSNVAALIRGWYWPAGARSGS